MNAAAREVAVVKAKPYPFFFTPKTTTLIVIDMQRDFIEHGGFGAVLGNDVSLLAKAVQAVKDLMSLCRRHQVSMIHTREAHRADLSDCPPAKLRRGHATLRIGDAGAMGCILIDGETGNEIVPELAPLPGETVIVKPGKGAFYATLLDDLLRGRGITHLLFAGVTTEVCVQTTMREANDRGYECLLVEDATESYIPAYKLAILEMLRAQGGIIGWTAPLAAITSALEGMLPPVRLV